MLAWPLPLCLPSRGLICPHGARTLTASLTNLPCSGDAAGRSQPPDICLVPTFHPIARRPGPLLWPRSWRCSWSGWALAAASSRPPEAGLPCGGVCWGQPCSLGSHAVYPAARTLQSSTSAHSCALGLWAVLGQGSRSSRFALPRQSTPASASTLSRA